MSIGIVSAQQINFYLDYSKSDKVELFENGQINWTKNYVLATESNEISLIEQNDYSYSEAVISQTSESALERLYGIVRKMKIDDYRTIDDVLRINDMSNAGKKLSIIFKGSVKVLEPIFITNTKFEVTAKIPIYGQNSLSSALYELFITNESLTDKFDGAASIRNNEYNKVIIDVRGMGFNPVIFPRIFYEDCTTEECKYKLLNQRVVQIENVKEESIERVVIIKEGDTYKVVKRIIEPIKETQAPEKIMENILFYGPELVPEEARKSNVYIKYFADPFLFKDEIWTKYKVDKYEKTKLAFFISALRVEGELMSDIIISKSDVARLKTRLSNLDMILSGNLYILTD